MNKDLIIAVIFLGIIIGATVYGVVSHDHTTNNHTVPTNTKNPTNATKQSQDDTIPPNYNLTIKPSYTINYCIVLNSTTNMTEVEFANNSFIIILNGLFNYPPSYIACGNYAITGAYASILFPNGTAKYVYIPIYQNIELKTKNTIKFYLVLEGNSQALETLYNYIEYLTKEGIESVDVTFYVSQDNQSPYQVQGVLYI
ncbi:MAG: hypothetical protein RXR43_11715 [Sulfolobus sp.]